MTPEKNEKAMGNQNIKGFLHHHNCLDSSVGNNPTFPPVKARTKTFELDVNNICSKIRVKGDLTETYGLQSRPS